MARLEPVEERSGRKRSWIPERVIDSTLQVVQLHHLHCCISNGWAWNLWVGVVDCCGFRLICRHIIWLRSSCMNLRNMTDLDLTNE